MLKPPLREEVILPGFSGLGATMNTYLNVSIVDEAGNRINGARVRWSMTYSGRTETGTVDQTETSSAVIPLALTGQLSFHVTAPGYEPSNVMIFPLPYQGPLISEGSDRIGFERITLKAGENQARLPLTKSLIPLAAVAIGAWLVFGGKKR
jgi:hypothetical protein